MQADIIESMHEQVRAIYRAITGEDVGEGHGGPATDETEESITRRFAELDAIARALPAVSARVPPFAFTPAIDVSAADGEVVLEVEVPGLAREDISVEQVPGALRISGVRRAAHVRGSVFHAEIPRGPFLRTIPLPFPVEAEPRIEMDRGVLHIHLKVSATSSNDNGENTGGNGK